VEDLNREFSEAAAELDRAQAIDVGVDQLWRRLDACHFDLNTCLREAIVLLKSFLVALPESEVDGFESTYRAQVRAARPSEKDRDRTLRHRRMAQIAGE
jgi:hypothetical protein